MNAPFPGASVPAIFGDNSPFRNEWLLWFQSLTQPGPIVSVPMAVSPFAYTASRAGSLQIVGGTLSAVSFSRGGTTVTLGTARAIPMANGDVVTITFTGSPTASFIPG